MHQEEYIKTRVKAYYWDDDINCASTTLKVLAEQYDIILENQVLDGAIGLHGAGGYGVQCGLVEGALIFIGILGKAKGIPESDIMQLCHEFAKNFEQKFGSLQCSVLRPMGFSEKNPPHLCESFTCKAISFIVRYIDINYQV